MRFVVDLCGRLYQVVRREYRSSYVRRWRNGAWDKRVRPWMTETLTEVSQKRVDEIKAKEGVMAAKAKARATAGRKLVTILSGKADPKAALNEKTGTRFRMGSKRQQAYDIIVTNASTGKTVLDVKKALKAAGSNAGRFAFVVASHPERFKVWDDDTLQYVGPKTKQSGKVAKRVAKRAKKAKKEKAAATA